ncbi:MAG: DUF1385 domain-containing protein [Candidatus Marinimicrobia bacterium]|jgi:uncharacterized protein YqhQ|nr:DUF1385 domain-containing protein [Candidatus Neomarinimicrobiota bacterium]MBT6413258.1 DUF1385 domain-containing protein [Candidatus Neomarinimicrobiota bacterium]MBT6797803.1 DUF1385 domain-containing protein [Candidatus Neomarinimicrobiota bacterium]MBT7945889.1 DUF1385 domain-containing protein [Candidatus Neomarinimicrobiota bacterium]|tara:strand:- start:13197 stop:14270 length:1074 start_codon:yes stop_codon:yes gene_type:complete
MLKYFSSILAEKSSMQDSPVQIKWFVSLRRFVNKVFRFNIKRNLLILTMKPSILVGGQAVIEGVMMRVPGAYATAVRDPEGKIHIQKKEFTSITEKSNLWNKPIFRGMASLFEAMKMGMATLQYSVDIAMPDEEEPSKLADFFSTAFAIVLAISLFMIAPMWITTKLMNIEKEALWFNLASGGFRIAFFVVYLLAISLLKDVRRLFQYHGAEHRVVYNFESGKDVNVENAQSFPTQHPRCGTSFLFIVLLSAILVFALVDTIVIYFLGTISLPIRLLFHLPMIPFVSGVGYEIIKLSAKSDSLFFSILKKPGLWLQNITTKQPENEMVDVSITALKEAFGDRYDEMVGKEYTAEAIG